MWFIINIILIILGCTILGYAKYIDSSENTTALMYGLLGLCILVSGGVSSVVKLIAGYF